MTGADAVIVILGVVVGALVVSVTILRHRVGDLRERVAALEVEVGRGAAHEVRTHGLPVDPAKDMTLRGRVGVLEGVAKTLLVPLLRRRRTRRTT